MNIGGQTEVGAIRRVALYPAEHAFQSDEAIARQWRELNYSERPEYARAVEEYAGFVALLKSFGIEIEFLPVSASPGLDSIYVRDASVVCDRGVILCNMGKPQRRSEPKMAEAAYSDIGVPVLGSITADGRLEGGDVAWIDERTLAVARGYRTNDEGIRQLRQLLGECIDEMIVVPLPHWRGPQDVFHLMSIFSPIDTDLAVVYSPLLPVPFRETLLSRGIRLVEVPEEEFETMGCNVLAVAPRRCVMLKGNPKTRARLESAGAEVHEYTGNEISLKGGGGPTCLTRPILRET